MQSAEHKRNLELEEHERKRPRGQTWLAEQQANKLMHTRQGAAATVECSYSDIYNFLFHHKMKRFEIVARFMMNALEDDGESPAKRCRFLRRTITQVGNLLDSVIFKPCRSDDPIYERPLPLVLLLGRLKTQLHEREAEVGSTINRYGADYLYYPPSTGFPRIMQEGVNNTLTALNRGSR